MTVISDLCCHLLFWKELRRLCLHTHWVQFLALVLLWGWVCPWMPSSRKLFFFFKGTKQIINQFLVQPLVDSWKISIQWASAGRFNTYWGGGGGSVYQSAFRRSYGSISTANVCIFHRCWTCLHESWFSVANGEAKSAASQNKNKKIKKINTHAAVECWFIYTSCELWRFHLLWSEQWLLITNTFASLLPPSPSPHFSTSELLNIFSDGCLCMLSVNFSPQMHLHAELKKKERDKHKKQTNKSLKSWTQFEISTCRATHWNSLRSSNANQTRRLHILKERNKFIYIQIHIYD